MNFLTSETKRKINGCAGLNPAAYRAVVEAATRVQEARIRGTRDKDAEDSLFDALTLAQREGA